MDTIHDGMQEIHLISRQILRLLNKQRLTGIQQPVDTILQVCLRRRSRINRPQPYKPCQLLHIRRIPVRHPTYPTSQVFRYVLARCLETLTDILHPLFLSYLFQIEKVAKTIEGITMVLKHLLHHVLLAAIQAIGHMALQLPYPPQLLLESQGVGEITYLLELIDTYHNTASFGPGYRFRESEHFLGRIVARIVLQGQGEVVQWVLPETYLGNKTA